MLCCGAPSVRHEEESNSTPSSSPNQGSNPNGTGAVGEERVRVPPPGRSGLLPPLLARGADPDALRREMGPGAGPPRLLGRTRSNKVAPSQPAGSAENGYHAAQCGGRQDARESFSSTNVQTCGVGPAHSTTGSQARNFTCEELQELGFTVYNPATIATDLPTSSSQPVAFLVLEAVDQRGSGVHEDTWPTTPARKLRNKVVPQFINSVCRSFFRISSHNDYAAVLRKLIKRDPLLQFAMSKAMRYLKAGECTPISHVTPDPSGQTSSLFGMRITPCIFPSGELLQPALLIEHNTPYNPAEIMPRLMRDYAVLSHVPAILTLIDFQGKVLYQNATSLAYMGDLLSVKYDNRLSEGLLRVLFMYDLHNLEQMLEDVLHGHEWQGVVQVPVSLRRYLAANHMSEAVDVNGSFTAAGRNPVALDDDLDVDFQIGDSFTSRSTLAGKAKKQQQKQAASYFIGRQSGLNRNLSLRELGAHAAAGAGASLLAASSNGHSALSPGSGLDPSSPDDSFTHEPMFGGAPSAASMLPHSTQDQPQRKFMTLLDKAGPQRGTRPSVEHLGAPGQSFALAQDHVPLPGQPITPTTECENGLEAVEEDEDSYDDAQECYHEIHAIPLLDPVLDKQVIMLVQTDVTPRVELENKLADLTDAQLSMLEQLFPRHIIEYMLARVPSRGGRNLRDLANTHEQVMVLFCDVVGFTSMSKEVEPSQVMHFLNELYEGFDELVDEYDMYKLDIVGDCYIVVAGLIKEDQDGFVCVDEMDEDQVINNAVRIMQFAKAMLRESQPVLMPHNSEPVQLRIGIHTGPLVSGLVGAKMPKFTLFGDTMNTASRMESTCQPGCVHVSDAFARLLPHEEWQSTGGVQVKGKGTMQTYLWVPKRDEQGLQDVEDMDPESAVKNLRKSLSRMNSFTSVKSRYTGRTSSTGKGDASSSAGSAINPLFTILHNIRGGDDSDDEGGGEGGGGRSGGRPSSGVRRRMRPSYVGQASADGEGAGLDREDSCEDGAHERVLRPHRLSMRRPSEGFRLTKRGGRRSSNEASLSRVSSSNRALRQSCGEVPEGEGSLPSSLLGGPRSLGRGGSIGRHVMGSNGRVCALSPIGSHAGSDVHPLASALRSPTGTGTSTSPTRTMPPSALRQSTSSQHLHGASPLAPASPSTVSKAAAVAANQVTPSPLVTAAVRAVIAPVAAVPAPSVSPEQTAQAAPVPTKTVHLHASGDDLLVL